MDESIDSDNEPRIRFTRRNLKGRMKLCPRCLSQIHLSNSLAGWLVPEEYYCENCGYHGHVALERMPNEKGKN